MINYYKFTVGNCDFFVLDTRAFRQMHDTKNPAKKGLSMLGQKQKQWLIEQTNKSDADFIFIISSVNFTIPHISSSRVTPASKNKDDAWTVFLDEREQLIDGWDKLDKPVFVLTGDLHNSCAIKITDNVWEFASAPHNSGNHRYTEEGSRPASGNFEYNGRKINIRWSSFFLEDAIRRSPYYCVVQVNNVFDNPKKPGEHRWVAFGQPQVIFKFYDGLTGELKYAEAVARPQIRR